MNKMIVVICIMSAWSVFSFMAGEMAGPENLGPAVLVISVLLFLITAVITLLIAVSEEPFS